MKIERTEKEVNALLDACAKQIYEVGGSQVRGQTYEEGIYEAIRWIIGESDHPYDEFM
jgi:hypothetical protein